MKYDDANIFAKILRREADAEIVYENQYVLCFLDIFPKAPCFNSSKKKYTNI